MGGARTSSRLARAHLTVAREEMEHLGIVLNLLSAIGEAPVMRRRNFPFVLAYDDVTLEMSLERFSAATIRTVRASGNAAGPAEGFARVEPPERGGSEFSGEIRPHREALR